MIDRGRAAAAGRIEWTRSRMPMLAEVRTEFERSLPFAGLTIGFRIHLEPKTAVLIETLLAGGAGIVAMGNEGTTQPGTVAVVGEWGCEVVERPSDGPVEVSANLSQLAGRRPELVLDNGAELIEACVGAGHAPRGATEETTSGAFRLRDGRTGEVAFPVIVINDSPLKAIVENKHAVGESVIDTIIRVTNVDLHKKRVVVFGYGWCGRGVALYARRRGADVTVVEPDPVKGLEAALDGCDVERAEIACAAADVVVTATGHRHVVTLPLIARMPDGVVLANAGHFADEIDVGSLGDGVDVSASIVRHQIDGRSVFLVASGRMVNLAAEGGMGNSIDAMDLGFTLQARSLAALGARDSDFPSGPQPVPDHVNDQVATAALRSMGQLNGG